MGATPLTPPVEATGEVGGAEYSVVDDPEPRTQITLAVLEHGLSPDELPLYKRLEALGGYAAARRHPVPDYPPLDGRRFYHAPAHFARTGPLNVGANPQLRNNDPRTREGFICVK